MSESALVKKPHCWKSHIAALICSEIQKRGFLVMKPIYASIMSERVDRII